MLTMPVKEEDGEVRTLETSNANVCAFACAKA